VRTVNLLVKIYCTVLESAYSVAAPARQDGRLRTVRAAEYLTNGQSPNFRTEKNRTERNRIGKLEMNCARLPNPLLYKFGAMLTQCEQVKGDQIAVAVKRGCFRRS
jgi:hypothetical protein